MVVINIPILERSNFVEILYSFMEYCKYSKTN